MHKKTLLKLLFILAIVVLVSIGLLALYVLISNLADLLSDDPDAFIFDYEREECYSIIYFSATILCVDLLMLFILSILFKKTKTKTKCQYKIANN